MDQHFEALSIQEQKEIQLIGLFRRAGYARCWLNKFDLFQKLLGISAGLAASIFYYQEVRIENLKQYLRSYGISVRL